MANKVPKHGDILDFDDYASLDDREMIEMLTKQLAALREESKTNPAITPALLTSMENGLKDYIASVEREKRSHQAVAIAKQKLDLVITKLLASPNTPDAKPIPIFPTKPRGN